MSMRRLTAKTAMRQHVLFFALCVLSGFALVGWSTQMQAGFWPPILGVFGGVMLGTGVSELGSAVSASRLLRAHLQETLKIVEDNLAPGLSSEEGEELSNFRRKWHHYNLSARGAEPEWEYTLVDFSQISIPGKLLDVTTLKDTEGRGHEYRVEGARYGSRFILMYTPTNEPKYPAVEVYPEVSNQLRRVLWGVAFDRPWDGKDETCVLPVLLRYKKLGKQKSGDIVDSQTSAKLLQEWLEWSQKASSEISLSLEASFGSHHRP